MNGLEAIADKILSEAQEKADRLIEQARVQSEETLAAARNEAAQILASSRESTARQADAFMIRAASAAALESRRTLLQARQDQLNQIMVRALSILSEMPENDRLAFYHDLIISSGATSGEITLSSADAHLGSRLEQMMDGHYTIASQAGSFSGGLLLKQGPIEDNLTFERLIAISRPQLVKLADDMLSASGTPVPGQTEP